MSKQTDVSIVIPWRGSDPHRLANLDRVIEWLTPLGLPIVLASDKREDGQPFCRSAAYNHGMELSPSEVFVWHEADVLVPHEQLLAATERSRTGLGLVVPFIEYRYMSEVTSSLILQGAKPDQFYPEWVMPHGRSIGAVGVCSAETMRWVGQWDETLEGHGFDDNAMFHAFLTATSVSWVDGPATHLWHRMAYAPWERNTEASDAANFSPEEVEATKRNKARVHLYQHATTPAEVRALTGKPWPND